MNVHVDASLQRFVVCIYAQDLWRNELWDCCTETRVGYYVLVYVCSMIRRSGEVCYRNIHRRT